MYRNTRRISVSFLTKIVSAARRNRRLSTKPVAGIVMLSTLVKPKEDCMAERLTISKTDLTQVGHASALADHSTSTGHNSKWDHSEILTSGQCDLLSKIKERLLIRDMKPALNEIVGSEKLFQAPDKVSFVHSCLASYQYLALIKSFQILSYFVTVTSEYVCCCIRNFKLNIPWEICLLCL